MLCIGCEAYMPGGQKLCEECVKKRSILTRPLNAGTKLLASAHKTTVKAYGGQCECGRNAGKLSVVPENPGPHVAYVTLVQCGFPSGFRVACEKCRWRRCKRCDTWLSYDSFRGGKSDNCTPCAEKAERLRKLATAKRQQEKHESQQWDRATCVEAGICTMCQKRLSRNGRRTCIECHKIRSFPTENQRVRTLMNYGGKCACCGESMSRFLSIDHINGVKPSGAPRGGFQLWKWLEKHEWPSGFRVLCINCNKAHGSFGYCPHNGRPPELEPAALLSRLGRIHDVMCVFRQDARKAMADSGWTWEHLSQVAGVGNKVALNIRNDLDKKFTPRTLYALAEAMGIPSPVTKGQRLCTECGQSCPESELLYSCCKLCRRARVLRLKLEVMGVYNSGRCRCCGVDQHEFLAIDHINCVKPEDAPRSGEELYEWIKTQNYPSGFTVLCHNCNLASYLGICPHEQIRQLEAKTVSSEAAARDTGMNEAMWNAIEELAFDM